MALEKDLIIVSNFNPKFDYTSHSLEEPFVQKLKREGYQISGSVDCWFDELPAKGTHYEWHQDDAGYIGKAMLMAIWASMIPTEIRRFDTKELITYPEKSIVIFQNELFEHRFPERAFEVSGVRWFARAWNLK